MNGSACHVQHAQLFRTDQARATQYTAAMTACPSCGATTTDGARFCPRCGAGLATACAGCGASLPEGAAFCASCGRAVTATPRAGEERRLVTIVFADVTGSTELGERLDPERFREVMQAYGQAMREEIEAEGGTVEKFIGDAVMAAFGVPMAHEDDPARALRAGRRMLARLRLVNDGLRTADSVELQIRIGVNTGEVLATLDPAPGEAMVTGDAVNAAARLEAMAAPGQIVVAERTAASVRGFLFDDLGSLELKGKARPFRAYALIDAVSDAPERGVPGLHAPMIGRDDELGLLRAVFERVLGESRPSVVTIYGDAGLGKSRLTTEFLSWAERTDAVPLVLRGRCLPYGDGVTYWPLAEILKGHAGILDSDGTDIAVEKVRKITHDLFTPEVAPDPTRSAAALAYTIGLEDPAFSFASLDPKDVRDEVHEVWRLFFSALARSGPVIVVIEDIHWADPVLLDLLDELSARAEGPILLVCPSRPELTSIRPSWGGGGRNATAVVLDPLSRDESEVLVRSLLTVDDLPPSVHATILERAEGNPFYIEEIVRRLIDEGAVVRTGERWLATEAVATIEIPDTVQGVLAARIDLLDPEVKLVVQAAAVVGRAFWPGPVAELTGLEPSVILERLRNAEDRELLRTKFGSSIAGQQEYLFKHILTRDVAYGSLPRRERAQAHRKVANWLQRSAGERVSEFAELLAYHLGTAARLAAEVGSLDADLRDDAVRWLRAASDAARRRSALHKAVRLAEEALELAQTDLQRAEALETLGDAHFSAYSGDPAFAAFVEAVQIRLRGVSEDGRSIAYAVARACEMPIRWPGSMKGRLPTEAELLALMEIGFAHLPPGDGEERIRLLSLRSGWLFAFPNEAATQSEIDAYRDAGVEASEIAGRLELWDLASAALDNAAGAEVSLGRYGPALPLWERRREVMPRVTGLLELGDFFSVGIWIYVELARFDEALRVGDEALATVGGRGPNVEVHTRAWLAAALHKTGRWDEALEHVSALRELLDDQRDDPPYFAIHAYGVGALVHESRSEGAEARRFLDTLARPGAERSGRTYPYLVLALLARGELDRSWTVERPWNWRVHCTDALFAESERAAASARWDVVPDLLVAMRSQAAAGPGPILVPAADRLEGRAALGAGVDATGILHAAADGFEALGMPHERALTQLDLAAALREVGRPDESVDVLHRAAITFEELRATTDLERIRRLG